MILTIFVVLLCISLFFIFLSYYIENPVLSIVGFFFIFILGTILFQGQIQYMTGSVTTLVDNTSTELYSYANFSDTAGTYIAGISINHFIGTFLSIIGVIGIAITLTDIKANKRKYED